MHGQQNIKKKKDQFMLFREIVAVYCEKYETHNYTMFKMQSTLLLK